MLDTSDRAVFVSGYDPSMGTEGWGVNIDDHITIVFPFDEKRRQFCITNAGNSKAYISLTPFVSNNLYTLSLNPHAYMTMDNYGGIVTAICNTENTTVLYVTNSH